MTDRDSSIVLSLCDYSGVMVMPWFRAGYECWIVDMQHPPGITRHGRLVKVGTDIRRWLPPRTSFRIAFGFPPCTNLAQSGARWFKDKGLAGAAEGLELVERTLEILEWTEAPWCLENPIGQLGHYWRKPDLYFDPCDYGGWVDPPADHYTKRTCLWTGGGFQLPEKMEVEPHEGSRMHFVSPGENRANIRSKTPRGFAYGVYEANR